VTHYTSVVRCVRVPYLEPLRDVAVVAGGEDDRVGGDAAAVDELGASADEPFDPRHDLDVDEQILVYWLT